MLSLSVGETGPVSGIVGDSDEFEYMGAAELGDRSSRRTTTTSTEWTQPYVNGWRSVYPYAEMGDLTGIEGIYGSISCRLSAVSGETASIRLYEAASNATSAVAESSVGASYERIHSNLGELNVEQPDFLDYRLKSQSGGEIVVDGPITVNFWRQIA